MKDAKSSPLFAPVMAHLKTRFEEDPGLLADSEGKSWENMEKYILIKAREQATAIEGGACAYGSDETLYEWAEDYIRLPKDEYEKMFSKNTPAPKAMVATSAPKKTSAPKPKKEEKKVELKIVKAPDYEQESMFENEED